MTNPLPLKTLAALMLLSATAWPAADPAGFHVWKAADLIAQGKGLSAKAKTDAHKVASAPFDTIGNRTFSMAHREGQGQAEWHEKQADIIMIQSGAVLLTYGGEVVAGTTTAPGEIRGDSIKGGTEVALVAGDVIHIPAKVPHMMKVAAGKEVTYFVAKVVE